MSQNDFHFKQFVVRQDLCAMKVGTDSVLLGAWVEPGNVKRILDIGTGTGLIALMLAQKSQAMIDAIDIDEAATKQAVENFRLSPWQERLHAINEPLQKFVSHAPDRYDLIVSNPPYFIGAHPAQTEARNIARHLDETLSMEELVAGVTKLMAPEGRFCVIFPFMEGQIFRDYARTEGLFANRITKVRTKVERQEKRLLMEFSASPDNPVETELVIQEEDLSFTQQYIELTKDYYLGLKKR